ncbi:MAG: hypothetical protein Q4D85_08045, partial [Corynebacterium sp.]|nr:hypothetical protein [Corynebacterium sp.]
DMRMLRPGVQGPVDPKTLRRNTTRKTNTEAYLMANGQLPLSDGVTSKMITPPADGKSSFDGALRQSHASPLGNPYGFNDKGLPHALINRNDQPDLKIRPDGSLVFNTPDGGYEKILPRPTHGSTLQPYQSYQRWDPATNTTTQQITYSNGMVIENTYKGKDTWIAPPGTPVRGINAIQPQTPLAATWYSPINDTLNVQETPLSPVASYQLSPTPEIPQNSIDAKTAWTIASTTATGYGGFATGVETVKYIDDLYAPEPSGLLRVENIDDLAEASKYLKKIGFVGDGINVFVGGVETAESGSAVPVSEATGSALGGAFGGMIAGALVGFAGGGPIPSAIGGALGAIAASEPGKIGGREIGERIDENF